MAIDADNFPTEGFNTQNLIQHTMDRVGSMNMMDVILNNVPRISRTIGARPPDRLNIPGMQNTAHVQNRLPPPNAATPVDLQPTAEQKPSLPKMNELPDSPKNLHTPQAKMMPGADTPPGQPISESEQAAFKRAIAANHVPVARPWIPNMPMPQRYAETATTPRTTYFKDAVGNEYKTVGDKLYVLGWQDARVKVRLINESNGKEAVTRGKKFQIFGWHLVSEIDSAKASKADDIDKLESEMCVKEEKNPTHDDAVADKKAIDENEIKEPSKPIATEDAANKANEGEDIASTADKVVEQKYEVSEESKQKALKRRLI